MVIGIQEGPAKCVRFLETKLLTVQPAIVPYGNTILCDECQRSCLHKETISDPLTQQLAGEKCSQSIFSSP